MTLERERADGGLIALQDRSRFPDDSEAGAGVRRAQRQESFKNGVVITDDSVVGYNDRGFGR